MSFQAGAYHEENRPITEYDVALFMNAIADVNYAEPRGWCSGGVFLAHSGFPGMWGSAVEVQPLSTDRASITFDGRLDNRGDLTPLVRDDLGGTASDAELALAIYLRLGPDGLSRLIGDWSLAIWDAGGQRIVLASDFAGVRPLYYYSDARSITWCTRLEALVKWVRPDAIDDQYVAGLLSPRAGYPDLTPYPGIYSVRPGHYLIRAGGRTELRPFWRPPTDGMVRFPRESDYEERLRELFRDGVRSRLGSGSTVISELSGGLDSSSVVCMVKHLIRDGSASPRRFVTLSYERQGSLDKRFCRAVEEWTGFENVHLPVKDQLFVSKSDPGAALPAFWSLLYAAVAAEAHRVGARTLLTGSLGDLIMGNWRDDSAQVAGLLRNVKILTALRESLEWSKALRMPVAGVLWRAVLLLLPASAICSRADLFSDGRQPAAGNEDSIAPAFRTRMGLNDRHRFSTAWKQARPERRKHFRGLLETLELRHLQPPEALAHLDFTHPFAHRPLVEYMLSIPSEIVCRPGEPRRLMRLAFQPLWPPALHGRRSKDSFGGTFLAALRPLAPGLLNDARQLQVVQRGYVDPVNLTSRLERLAYSLDNNAAQLRRLILLELWLQRATQSAAGFKERPPAPGAGAGSRFRV